MHIRFEQAGDEAAVSALIAEAFAGAEHSAGNEARIVEKLREAGALAVSLVATDEGRIIGHVAFSPVTIDGESGGWFGLGPLAVVPRRQRRGCGSALVSAGLAVLRERQAEGCVVLGEPGYYRRFGFEADPGLRLEGVPPAYFQRLQFSERSACGVVEYHPAFQAA
ncbi:MAG: GNAT family N-acetyltransferase [Bacillota bacterium]